MKGKTSDILDAVHDSARALHDAGVMPETTMKEFDALCLSPTHEVSADEIKALWHRLRVSQPVFAVYLGVTKSTVSQWEQGAQKASSPGLAAAQPGRPERLEAIA
jgi:putative transcriptional regulator